MTFRKPVLTAVLLFAIFFSVVGQPAIKVTVLPVQVNASFRGASVVNDSIAWISGSDGWIGKTTDGGRTWRYRQIANYDTIDFRSIFAFDSMRAIVANAGAPSNILLTEDGGKSWKLVYHLVDDEAFIDGIDFWNEKEGLIYGDPIKRHMLLVRTFDGGRTWARVSPDQSPALAEGEASFAASGTGIRCLEDDRLVIATGGKKSRLLLTDKKLSGWKSITPPVLQGESATGIFSVAVSKSNDAIIVGGDYLQDTLKVDHVFYAAGLDGAWHSPANPTRGYRECVEFFNDSSAIAVGPGGIDITFDKGKTWKALSDEKGFHVARKARDGRLVILAGGKGKTAILGVD